MKARIVLFLNGTWDDAGTNTNVHKLYLACPNTNDQVVEPFDGVGAGLDWYNPKKWLSAAGGLEISKVIKKAYRVIAKNYQDSARTHLFIFGFSRGAYAARSLVGFIDKIGLIKQQYIDEIPWAYSEYMKKDPHISAEEWRTKFRKLGWFEGNEWRPIQVYFLGVWDTVGKLGVPFPTGSLNTFINNLNPYVNFHNTHLPDNVTNAYHALAMHELRPAFTPCLWTKRGSTTQVLEQVWFVGDHADVGGGHEKPSGISDNSLLWMAEKAICLDLDVNRCLLPTTPNPKAGIHHRFWDPVFFWSSRVSRRISKRNYAVSWNQADVELLTCAWNTIGVHNTVIERWQDRTTRDHKFRIGGVNPRLDEAEYSAWSLFMEKFFEAAQPLAADKCTSFVNTTSTGASHLPNPWWTNVCFEDLSECKNRLNMALRYVQRDPPSLRSDQVAFWCAVLLGMGMHKDVEEILSEFVTHQQVEIKNFLSGLSLEEFSTQVELWRKYVIAIQDGLRWALDALPQQLRGHDYQNIVALMPRVMVKADVDQILLKKKARR